MTYPSFFYVFLPFPTFELRLLMGEPDCDTIQANEADRIQFSLNLELLKAEFFLNGAVGQGLNTIDPSLAQHGPPRIGTKKANLDPVVDHIIKEFSFQVVDIVLKKILEFEKRNRI